MPIDGRPERAARRRCWASAEQRPTEPTPRSGPSRTTGGVPRVGDGPGSGLRHGHHILDRCAERVEVCPEAPIHACATDPLVVSGGVPSAHPRPPSHPRGAGRLHRTDSQAHPAARGHAPLLQRLPPGGTSDGGAVRRGQPVVDVLPGQPQRPRPRAGGDFHDPADGDVRAFVRRIKDREDEPWRSIPSVVSVPRTLHERCGTEAC